MKRTELKRGKPLKRTGKMKAVSDKRRVKLRERRKIVEQIAEERGPWCQARIDGVCDGLAIDPHEVLARSAVGSITDPENIKLLCRSCHEWIPNNHDEAEALGLWQSRYGGDAA